MHCVLYNVRYKSDVEAIIDSACQEQQLEIQLNDIEEEWSEQVCVRVHACVSHLYVITMFNLILSVNPSDSSPSTRHCSLNRTSPVAKSSSASPSLEACLNS